MGYMSGERAEVGLLVGRRACTKALRWRKLWDRVKDNE
jgi:hypothetical protein